MVSKARIVNKKVFTMFVYTFISFIICIFSVIYTCRVNLFEVNPAPVLLVAAVITILAGWRIDKGEADRDIDHILRNKVIMRARYLFRKNKAL